MFSGADLEALDDDAIGDDSVTDEAQYEEAFAKMKKASGVSDIDEVVRRFETQEETSGHLQELQVLTDTLFSPTDFAYGGIDLLRMQIFAVKIIYKLFQKLIVVKKQMKGKFRN